MEPEVFAGFSRSQRAPKRLRDIAPNDVVVNGPLLSEAEDSEVEMSPSKPGKPRRKSGKRKAKKDDGWIWKWLERGRSVGSGDDQKLEEYRRESKCKICYFQPLIKHQACEFNGFVPKQRCTAG